MVRVLDGSALPGRGHRCVPDLRICPAPALLSPPAPPPPAPRLAYIPAAILQTEHFYDLMGTVGFVTGTVYTLVSTNAARSQVALAASTCVLLWALRLGTFLFSRFVEED